MKFLLIFLLLLSAPLVYANDDQAIDYASYDYDKEVANADSLFNAGEYNVALNRYFSILDYLQTEGKDDEETHGRKARCYYRISYIYLFEANELSIEYAEKAIQSSLLTKDDTFTETCYSLKYYCLYDVPGSAEELDFLADKCIEYSERLKNDEMMAEAYMHKCNSLVELKRIEEGDTYCKKAEAIFERINRGSYLASVYNNIGNVFVKAGDLQRALNYHQKAYDLEKTLGNVDGFIESSGNMADDHFKLGNYQRASEFYRIHLDSLTVKHKRTLDKKFTEADARFNGIQKDKEIAEKELVISQKARERNLIIFLSIIVVLVLLGVYQWYLFKQRKKKIATEEALRNQQEMNRLRTNFLENVAHEIRTPITLINGHLKLALEDSIDDETRRHINLALENSRRIQSDSNEILDLLKFEKGKLPMRMGPLPLQSFLRRVFYSFESLAAIKKVELKFSGNVPDDLTIQTDEGRLEKILNNLISNAVKFAPTGSTIEMNAQIQSGELTVKVNDEGPGIAKEEQEKIFTRFYQSERNESIGGVGVGLSLAREFSDSLKGKLRVESELGNGASFQLILPFEESKIIKESEHFEESLSEEEETFDTDFLHDHKVRVLIVEDNPEMNDYLAELLQEEYQCDRCFDGMEALQKVQTEQYSLIISDIMMPNMDGFEFREKVCSMEKYKLTPFIFITAKVLMEDKLKGFRMGVDDYITKPFEKEELIARIRATLTNKLERERFIKDQSDSTWSDDPNADEKLLIDVRNAILAHIDEEDYRVTDLATEVSYSQRQLARLLNKHVGLSPVQYMLELRLQMAYRALADKRYSTLSEVRHSVGISSASYFNKKFKERFGKSPADLLKE